MATRRPSGSGADSSPGRPSSPSSWFCSTNRVWNSGWRPSARAGLTSSTSRSNGTSCWAKASSCASRTRPRSSAKDGSPDVSVRSTRVLTKKPTRSFRASSERPATPVPSGMSVPAPRRVNSAARPAWRTANRVDRWRRASSASAVCSSGSRVNGTASAAPVGTGGRGRSTGSSSSSGRPARTPLQWSS